MKKRNKIAKQNYILICVRSGGSLKASRLRQGKEKFHICFGNLKIKVPKKVVRSLINQNILIYDGSNLGYTYFKENR